MGKYFGTDGVRGVANKDLTPELAYKLGRCGGYVLTKNIQKPKILIGRDPRISGDMLEGALIAGLLSIGAEVMRLDRESTRLNSSHVAISYAVVCLKKKNKKSN